MTDSIPMYLDNAATTPLDPRVLEAMLPFFMDKFGNPSSIHRTGREAKVAVEQAREYIALLINAAPQEIIFTSGGTEANNTALLAALSTRPGFSHIVSSSAEHEAILKPLAHYQRVGHRITLLDVDRYGSIPFDVLRDAVYDDTALIALMHANNETGALNDIEAAGAFAAEREIHFHTDAVQSAGKTTIDSRQVRFDSLSISAHKIHGPKGVGALYLRAGNKAAPMMLGGAQERGRRGGTENVPGIVGFGEAARLALAEREERQALWIRLQQVFRQTAASVFPDSVMNTPAESVGTICSITFPFERYRLDGEALLMNMDMEGVALSTGSACTAGSVEPSHVMRAIGYDLASAKATLRFSFGKDTTENEVRTALERLQTVIHRMQLLIA